MKQESLSRRDSRISRRDLMASAAVAAVAISAGTSKARAASSSKKFKLKYAPGFGMFRQHAGKDPIDSIKFMSDQGFRAIFDNGLMRKPADQVDKIVKEVDPAAIVAYVPGCPPKPEAMISGVVKALAVL